MWNIDPTLGAVYEFLVIQLDLWGDIDDGDWHIIHKECTKFVSLAYNLCVQDYDYNS